ncbi:hypothetical protein CCR75_000938 [Bremia lactucae]|uniref:Uncharacterized protein n=1 Tax=Bremia lactucae TaxID=4779 RepID=A0A976IEM1_BRELC|nr:hypothetical protein CCR75_000938 [Bremia lactucae]
MSATRVLRGGLTWPAVRGARLLRALTAVHDELGKEQEDEVFPYDLELCVPTAGHVALVLVQKPSENQVLATNTQQSVTVPRVVYVLDALPPTRQKPRDEKAPIRKKRAPRVQFPPCQIDDLELLEELFAPQTRAAGGNDGSVILKPPILCARFDSQVVSIRFIRSSHSPLSRTQKVSSGSQNRSKLAKMVPLRCIVARVDGMAFLWEWQADLCQWVFLNRVCFLENPNLKWTKPVASFTTTDMPFDSRLSDHSGSSGATEFVWWSTATKNEPRLKLRQLRFERATDALRATDVIVGSAFTFKPVCDDLVALLSSKLGLFAISRTQGLFFRSSTASLQTLHLNWLSLFTMSHEGTVPATSQLSFCIHTVTGELLLLYRDVGDVYLVTPKPPTSCISSTRHETGTYTILNSKKLTTIRRTQTSDFINTNEDKVLDIAAHRHEFLVLTSRSIDVHSLISGILLERVRLPTFQSNSEKYKFWTISGASSSIGLWASSGFWTIRLPSVKAIATALHVPQLSTPNEVLPHQDAKAAFLAVKDYGIGDLQFESVRYALDVLERVTRSAMDPFGSHPNVWKAVWHTVSSPALLLALLDDQATSERVIQELAHLVTTIYQSAIGIHSYGRLDGANVSNLENPLRRLTRANLESLHHLSNWIILAKRKVMRLETSAGTLVDESMLQASRVIRAVSDLSQVLANQDDLCTIDDKNLPRKDSIVDPEDARNFRLSRKLRPMSSLRFAAGCSTDSERQGTQWLLQLESFLLNRVAFKKNPQLPAGLKAEATPSHRLFHSERVLTDFRHVAASSFSKHMYLESMSRLYLLYEPESLLSFLQCVEQYCPRFFTLSGQEPLIRSNAERAMTLFPPMTKWTNQVLEDDTSKAGQAAKASLLAYVDILRYCGYHTEACRALLLCHMYEKSKELFFALFKRPQDAHDPGDDGQEKDTTQAQAATTSSVYFLLLNYCIKHRDVTELKTLLMLKPTHVNVLHVFNALRTNFSSSKQNNTFAGIKVGDLRAVLVALMQQRRDM